MKRQVTLQAEAAADDLLHDLGGAVEDGLERDPSWRQLIEDLVHHLGALGERRTDLVAVDRLCRGRAIMAD